VARRSPLALCANEERKVTSDPTIDLLQARGRLKQNGLSAALENLRYKYGSMFDFAPVGVVDDRKFREANPDHPMAEPQRFIRQGAADFVNNIAAENPTSIDQTALERLHDALFDRCPAVRMAIAQALGTLRRADSIPVLRRLLAAEDESEWVRSAAEKALADCLDAEGGA
jgi:hypothetical protein